MSKEAYEAQRRYYRQMLRDHERAKEIKQALQFRRSLCPDETPGVTLAKHLGRERNMMQQTDLSRFFVK